MKLFFNSFVAIIIMLKLEHQEKGFDWNYFTTVLWAFIMLTVTIFLGGCHGGGDGGGVPEEGRTDDNNDDRW